MFERIKHENDNFISLFQDRFNKDIPH